MPSKKIEDLVPELQILFHEFSMACHDAGIQFIVTCTYRPQIEQDLLFKQGRSTPGRIVTWTHTSLHTARKAFDIAVCIDGKVSWNPEDYKAAGDIGRSIGLECGIDWKHPDPPHFQLKGEHV